MNIKNLIVGLLLGVIAFFALSFFGVPDPLPFVVGALVFVLVLFYGLSV